LGDSSSHRPALAAFADGPVADTAEPVAAEAGRPIPEPDRHDSDAVRCGHLIDPKGTTDSWLRCVGRVGHTAPHWWSLVGEGAWQFVGESPHV
jgi:hypothetical protein